MVSHLLPFMADITLSHCFEYISMAIALHRCLLYIFRTCFSMWIQLWCPFDNWTNPFWQFWELTNLYMHSVPFFNTNSTIMFWWWFWEFMYIYMHSVSFLDMNSTTMVWWWLDWLIVVILRVYVYLYLYAFCIVFWHEFNYNICVVIRLICFGNLHICMCILYHFSAWIQLWCLCGD